MQNLCNLDAHPDEPEEVGRVKFNVATPTYATVA